MSMTDDRASLGARIAEAMGWVQIHDSEGREYWKKAGGQLAWPAEELLCWTGYSLVDAWMREQGYGKIVRYNAQGDVGVLYWQGRTEREGYAEADGDEPLAAIQAALKALEARE